MRAENVATGNRRAAESKVKDVIAWLKTRSEVEGDCWIWQRAVNSAGAPVASVDGVSSRSVRNWAAELLKGGLEGKKIACKCDEGLCVNPEHWLALGPGDMNRWMWRQGRMDTLAVRRSRAMNGRTQSHLGIDQVREMRQRRARNEILRTIAKDFNVSISCASNICRGTNWHDFGSALAEVSRVLTRSKEEPRMRQKEDEGARVERTGWKRSKRQGQ